MWPQQLLGFFFHHSRLWSAIFISVIGQNQVVGRQTRGHMQRCDIRLTALGSRSRKQTAQTHSLNTHTRIRTQNTCVQAHSNLPRLLKQLRKPLQLNITKNNEQSIISSSVCLQIFVDVFMILCGFFYASIKRVFAQSVNPRH